MTEKFTKDEVVDYIQTKIREGKLEPGDKLPSEMLLSKRLNISRASLREALQKLETVGLIEIKHGKGSFISSSPCLNAFQNFIPPLVISNNHDVLKLLEARRFVEIGTARLAAENTSVEDHERLRKYIGAMEGALDDENVDKFLQNDLNFHLKIAQASGNEILHKLLQALRVSMVKELNVIMKVPGMPEFSLHYHKKIFTAIEEEDEQKAGREMDEHLLNAKEMFEESVKQVEYQT